MKRRIESAQLSGRPEIIIQKVGKNGPLLEIWPRPGACAMLFYPGTMLAPGHYAPLLLALHEAGFTVAAPHFSGHGLNRRARLHTFGQMLGEGLAAERWLLENGYGQACLCGHSQGGILTLAHAAASGNIPAAFAICAAFPQAPESMDLTLFRPLRGWRRQCLAVIMGLARLLPRLPLPMPFYISPQKILAGKKAPLSMGRDKGRAAYPLEFLASLFNARLPLACNGFFHLIAAKNDALFTPRIIKRTFNRIKAPRKRLIWLEEGGHMAPMNLYLAGFIAKSAAAACAGIGLPIKSGLRAK